MTVNNYFKTWTPAGTIWGVFPFDDSDVIATRRAYEDAKSCQRHAELASPVSDDVNEQPDRNDPRQAAEPAPLLSSTTARSATTATASHRG